MGHYAEPEKEIVKSIDQVFFPQVGICIDKYKSKILLIFKILYSKNNVTFGYVYDVIKFTR